MVWRRMLDEIDAIRREIDETFEEIFAERPMWDTKGRLKPLVTVTEVEDKVIVTMDLPLVEKKDIKLNVTEKSVEVNAELCRCVRYEHWGTIQRQCEFKYFNEFVKLPCEVIPDKVNTKFKHGILVIELPKKVRRYEIKIE